VIGEDFEPRLVESRRMGCVSFAQLYFPGGAITRENFQRARMAAIQKLETLSWQYRIQGWNVALGHPAALKRRTKCCWLWVKKTVLLPRNA
jgi:exopolyphosphatase/guanosine-5'-triphosphate,3'-diphosphate pyrophosphatase